MRLLLVAGFLGSGKTTLIVSLARRAASAGLKSAIVVNEVGEVGIDGAVLSMGDLEVREITSGCICCQIGVDLIRTLRELGAHYGPDLVVIEASGIATPAGVVEALRQYPVETVTGTRTVSLVDPVRFEALYAVLTPLIEAQITGGDVLVITKNDQASATEIEAAARVVRQLAPAAPLFVVDATSEASLDGLLVELLPELSPQAVSQAATRAVSRGLG